MMCLEVDGQEPNSWRGLLDRCLQDGNRYWRFVLLLLLAAGCVVLFSVLGGWPSTAAIAVVVGVVFRRRQ